MRFDSVKRRLILDKLIALKGLVFRAFRLFWAFLSFPGIKKRSALSFQSLKAYKCTQDTRKRNTEQKGLFYSESHSLNDRKQSIKRSKASRNTATEKRKHSPKGRTRSPKKERKQDKNTAFLCTAFDRFGLVWLCNSKMTSLIGDFRRFHSFSL